MITARKHIDPPRVVPASQPRASSSSELSTRSDNAQPKSVKHSLAKSGAWSGGETLKAKKPMYDEAVQRVREWNEALNGKNT